MAGAQEEPGRKCRLLSYMFYQAVRDQKPVWTLEDMRNMECFHWEEKVSDRFYSPSEALLYALVHNHRPYARYLLRHFPEEALKPPGAQFCSCSVPAPHLAMAVTYDRRDILAMILQMAHRLPGLGDYLNRTGCAHLEGGKSPLHLACELLRAETILVLLGHGASPCIRDAKGQTPLDIILEQLRDSKVNVEGKKRCLEHLLLYLPRPHFKMQPALREQPEHWRAVLGERKYNYLVGSTPATLYLHAMHAVLRCLPPAAFPRSIQELPIPRALKPLPAHYNKLPLDSVEQGSP